MSDPEIRRSIILDVIDNQIRGGEPPETKETYDRLLAQGYPEEEVMTYIGAVVSSEVFDVIKEQHSYDEERYVAALRALPRLPWVEE